MTRQEAIDAIISTWNQRDNNCCISQADEEESETLMRECLFALGVKTAEIERNKYE